MADLKLKYNGLKFLDSRVGDFMLADQRLNMQLLFTKEFLQLASEDPQKMMLLGKKLFDFLGRHTEARWLMVEKQLKEIELFSPEFVTKYFEKLKTRTIDDLRKLEKDIYFFLKNHAENN